MLDELIVGHRNYQMILFYERISESLVLLSCTTKNLNYLLE